MNITKIFFTLTFFLSFSIISQAQVSTVNSNNNITVETYTTESKQDNISTITPAESNITITQIDTNKYVFSFNHKQFLNPVPRKKAYC